MWTSVVGYFTDSSKIAAIYEIITLIILQQSFENQKSVCQIETTPRSDLKYDVNEVCSNRLLFNGSLHYEIVGGGGNKVEFKKHFSDDANYFIVPYVYGFHICVIFGTVALSPHLLPISFYLIRTKTGVYFNDWNKISLNSIYRLYGVNSEVTAVLEKYFPDKCEEYFFIPYFTTHNLDY